MVCGCGHYACHVVLQEYMQQSHGKSLDLKHITVKVPNKRLPVARVTTTPPTGLAGAITIDQTDSLLNDSDHSPSLSPTPPTPVETSLDFCPTATPSPGVQDRGSLAAAFNEQGRTPPNDFSGSCKESNSSTGSVSNGRGHNRNNSMDEVLMKMRSTGMTFSEMEERPSTLSRLHRGRADKPRSGFLSVLAPVRPLPPPPLPFSLSVCVCV